MDPTQPATPTPAVQPSEPETVRQISTTTPQSLSASTKLWKTVATILLLFLFTPIGVLLMFVWTRWSIWTKIGVAIIMLPIFTILVLFIIFLLTVPGALQHPETIYIDLSRVFPSH